MRPLSTPAGNTCRGLLGATNSASVGGGEHEDDSLLPGGEPGPLETVLRLLNAPAVSHCAAGSTCGASIDCLCSVGAGVVGWVVIGSRVDCVVVVAGGTLSHTTVVSRWFVIPMPLKSCRRPHKHTQSGMTCDFTHGDPAA